MKQDPGGAQIPGPISYLSHSNKINTSSLVQNIWQFDHDPNDEILMHMLSNKIRKKHSYEPIKQSVKGYRKGAIINNSRDVEMLAEYHSMMEESSNKMSSEYEFNQMHYKHREGKAQDSNLVLEGLETGNKPITNSNMSNNIKQSQRAHQLQLEHTHSHINRDTGTHAHRDAHHDSRGNDNRDNGRDNDDNSQHKQYGISSVKTLLVKPPIQPVAGSIGNNQLCNNYYRNEDILCNKIISNHNYIMGQVKETMQLIKYMYLMLQVQDARKLVIKHEIDCRRLRISLRTSSAGSTMKRRLNNQPNNVEQNQAVGNLNTDTKNNKQQQKQMQIKKQYDIGHLKPNMQINIHKKSNNINHKFSQHVLNAKSNSPCLPNAKSSTHLKAGKQYLRVSRSAKNIMKQMSDQKSSEMIKIYSKISWEYKDKEKEEWLGEQIRREKDKQERLRTKQILVNNYYESLAKKSSKVTSSMKYSNMLNVSNDSPQKPAQQIETEQTIMNTKIQANTIMNAYKQSKKQSTLNSINKNDPEYKEVLANKRKIIQEILQESNRHFGYKIGKLQEENKIMHNQIALIDDKLREASIECSKLKSNPFLRKRNGNSKHQIKTNNINKITQQAHQMLVDAKDEMGKEDRGNSIENKVNANSAPKRKRHIMRSPSYGHEYGYLNPGQKQPAKKQSTKWSSMGRSGLRRAQSHQHILPSSEQVADGQQKQYKISSRALGNNETSEISLQLIEQEREQYNMEYGQAYHNEYQLRYSSHSHGFDTLDHL